MYSTLLPAADVSNPLPIDIPHTDKLFHFGSFVILTVLFYWAYDNLKITSHLLLGVLLGFLIELLQGYLPYGRTADIFDFIADVLGTLVGFTVLKFAVVKS